MSVATWRSNLKPVGDPLKIKSPRTAISASSIESTRSVLLKTWPKKGNEANNATVPSERAAEKKFSAFKPVANASESKVRIESAPSIDSTRNALQKTWPAMKANEAGTPNEREKKSPTSRWSHLSAANSFMRSKSTRKDSVPQKKQSGNRITADELLAREFTSAEKAVVSPRQRSNLFLKKIELFEGEIPGKLLATNNVKPENAQLKIDNEKLDFCSNEMIDMRRFLIQIEEDFLQIRDVIEKTKEKMKDIRMLNDC